MTAATKKPKKVPVRPRPCPMCGAPKAVPACSPAGTVCLSCQVQKRGGGLW